MNSIPQSVQQVQDYFIEKLLPLYDKAEISNFCYLSFAHFLNFSRHDIHLKSDTKLKEPLAKLFMGVVDELTRHRPIQYILGETEFYGLRFLVNEHVLIPRPETEELVNWILRDMQVAGQMNRHHLKTNFSVLDLGTGSGCIPVSIKMNLPDAQVAALDISAEALAVAQQNALLNQVEIDFIQHNMLEHEKVISHFQGDQKFNLLVSNPPYVCFSESKFMDNNVLDYEPHLALFVEDSNPLVFYESIAEIGQQLLHPNGQVYVEINQNLGIEMCDLFMNKGFTQVELRKDLNGRDRMIKAVKV